MIRTAYAATFILAATHLAAAADIPAKLVPPAGATLSGAYEAQGVQIYVCTARGTVNEAVFKAPEARLTDKGKVIAKHYAGPTWEATDGSKVVGKVLESVPAPAAGDVPWLLLAAQSSGQGAFADVRFVQRIETSGGSAPAGSCPTPGAELRVPYSATYRFFR
jgi:hypothetical protein